MVERAAISLFHAKTSYMKRPGPSSPVVLEYTSPGVPAFSKFRCSAVAAPPPNIHSSPPCETQVPSGLLRPGPVSQRSSDMGSCDSEGGLELSADLRSVYQTT